MADCTVCYARIPESEVWYVGADTPAGRVLGLSNDGPAPVCDNCYQSAVETIDAREQSGHSG